MLRGGLRRIREYCLPLEFARMKAIGRHGTVLAKILQVEIRGRVRVILVRYTIGY